MKYYLPQSNRPKKTKTGVAKSEEKEVVRFLLSKKIMITRTISRIGFVKCLLFLNIHYV